MSSSKLVRWVTVSALAATALVVGPTAANAAPNGEVPTSVHLPTTVCTDVVTKGLTQQGIAVPAESSPTYFHTTYSDIYIGDSGSRVYGGGGGTLNMSKTRGWSVTGSITGTASADAGVIFAQVSVSVALSVGYSKSGSTSDGYSWLVPAGTTGWIEAGAHSYKIAYDKGHYVSPCTWVSVQKNTIYGATGNTFYMNSVAYATTPHM